MRSMNRETIKRLAYVVHDWMRGVSVPTDIPVMAITYCMDTLLELLKEQETIKPTVSVDTWICSKCGHVLESQDLIDDKENPQVLLHELYKYCPNCGRAVKWDA